MARRVCQDGANPKRDYQGHRRGRHQPVMKFIIIPRVRAAIAIGFLPNISATAPKENVPGRSKMEERGRLTQKHSAELDLGEEGTVVGIGPTKPSVLDSGRLELGVDIGHVAIASRIFSTVLPYGTVFWRSGYCSRKGATLTTLPTGDVV